MSHKYSGQTLSQTSVKNYTKPYTENQRSRIPTSVRKEMLSTTIGRSCLDSNSFSSFLVVSICFFQPHTARENNAVLIVCVMEKCCYKGMQRSVHQSVHESWLSTGWKGQLSRRLGSCLSEIRKRFIEEILQSSSLAAARLSHFTTKILLQNNASKGWIPDAF
jgi:hypothetical protein